jgi:glyoxylase-like metal-dependent hydrolase (beta-lactamase superfamily II)
MRRIFQVEDMTIHRIVEMEQGFVAPRTFFPDLTEACLEENRHWLEPVALDVQQLLVLCFQSFIVTTPHHTILIDTCVGNDKDRANLPVWHFKSDDAWMRSLAAHGLTVEDIDFVMCTHLHVDHVGWNTKLENGRWVPTFPRARYLFSEKELAFWTEESRKTPLPYMEDSVLPIVAAQRADLVRSDHQLGDHLRLLPTPGHTIDHFSVELGRGSTQALLTGDAIHSPLQARYPELSMRFDHDADLSRQSRRALLERCCESNALTCFAHFPSPSVARVKRWDSGFRCEFVSE